LEEERLRLDWVSASEGERFSRIVNEFIEAVKPFGPANWRAKLSDWGMTNRRTVSSDSQRVRNLLSRIGQHKSPSSSHLKPVITMSGS
jgi:hypothetical protein